MARKTSFSICEATEMVFPDPIVTRSSVEHNTQYIYPDLEKGTASSYDDRTKVRDLGENGDEKLAPFERESLCTTPLSEEPQSDILEFDGKDDPLHPFTWSVKKKLPENGGLTTKLIRRVFISFILGFTTFTLAFSSALFSTATSRFHVSDEVGVLGVSLYVLGFATGPVFWAPLSELQGRRWPIVVSLLLFALFQLGVAAGKDLQTVLLCRFWSGLSGASPMTIGAAIFSDMFDDRTRGLAITVFSMNVLTDPLLAPFVGGYITENLGWRWTAWIVAIMGFVAFALDLVFLEETYGPKILSSKAAELRRRTNNWAIHTKYDEIELDMRQLLTNNFTRPLRLLFLEPLILLLSIYLAFIYGLLYLFLTAYPIVFQQIHGMSQGVGGLPYLAMVFRMFLAGFTIILTQSWYQRKLAENNGVVIPEWRLPPVIFGGVIFAIGVFWLGWSGYKKDIHWIAPTLSGIFTGYGLLAASANAGSTIMRSLCGAGFPLFASAMFKNLGVNWACTLLGGIATICVPIPVLFYIYGHKLRERSKFAG
ncbi:putative MFS-type transporter [Lachnellula subtilissima]|uniref:Putative MFS-type transporter n=1 Tax=Lachnellula subtilissima TaxID=602034 RepID=A0A8H8UF87_9HELO|nr:putative MFS-type transporter [Lachnellula subtilissima]